MRAMAASDEHNTRAMAATDDDRWDADDGRVSETAGHGRWPLDVRRWDARIRVRLTENEESWKAGL